MLNKKEIDRLLIKVANGDNDAFEKLYEHTKRGVYAFLYSYFRNAADSEDAMQTVYLKIKKNIGSYKKGTNGSAWILQIAKNTALNDMRSAANFQKQKKREDGKSADATDSFILKNSIVCALNEVLDEEERRIVVLHVVWAYKHKEIAQTLNCPIGTVTSKYKRAVDKLKKALKEE